MSYFRLILVCFCAAILGTELSKVIVEGKVQLCHPPPNWTINNGTDPMKESLGNVTLVTLLNASFRFGLKQALSLENMLRFFRSTGFKKFRFIIVNANDFDASQKFKELSDKVSFAVYQETDSEKVWDVLDGGIHDIFIYDRCGLLTYYIPFPLSIIHPQQPILEAALLSTYFDNPCGETCDRIPENTIASSTIRSPVSETSTTSRTTALSAINATLNETLFENIEGLKDLEQNSSAQAASDLIEENVFLYDTTQTNDTSGLTGEFPDEISGSGSGDEPLDESIDSSVATGISTSPIPQVNRSSTKELTEEDQEVPWKIFDFFKKKNNRTDEEIYNEIYNASNSEFNSDNYATKVDPTPTQASTPVNQTTGWTKSSQTLQPRNVRPSVRPTTPSKKTRFSFFGSAARAKCDAFNQTKCVEWSTDKLLRARLCCLTQMLGNDEDSGFGCKHFDKNRCNRMLPLIKCCLKDFSQLLETYFQSVSKPSRSRNRYNLNNK